MWARPRGAWCCEGRRVWININVLIEWIEASRWVIDLTNMIVYISAGLLIPSWMCLGSLIRFICVLQRPRRLSDPVIHVWVIVCILGLFTAGLCDCVQMSVSLLSCALRSLSLGSRTVSSQVRSSSSSSSALTWHSDTWSFILCRQIAGLPAASGVSAALTGCRGFMTSSCDLQNRSLWKQRDKYTTRPIGMKKTGGRDYTGQTHSDHLCVLKEQFRQKVNMC